MRQLGSSKTSRRFEIVRRELNNALGGLATVCMMLFAFHSYTSGETEALAITNRALQQEIDKSKMRSKP